MHSTRPLSEHNPRHFPLYNFLRYESRRPANAVSCSGVLKNFNTIEDFKAADKTVLFNQVADEVRLSIAVDS